MGIHDEEMMKDMKNWNTEVYLMNPAADRDYFIDKTRTNPIGLSEQFNVTLAERPNIPTAELRYDNETVHGKPGDQFIEDNYDNIEIELYFNYISSNNARETYHSLTNSLARMTEGTRLRFSDDDDGTFRELARKPIVEPLNNDLYNWGDFVITLVLKPFRHIEQGEIFMNTNANIKLKQPLPNAMKSPQKIRHTTERSVNIEVYKNNDKIYEIDSNNSQLKHIETNAEQMNTYGGD